MIGLDVIGASPSQPSVTQARTIVGLWLIGIIGGVVGGAKLWTAHPVAGALIGGLIVGPAVGGGVGMLIASGGAK